MEDAMNGDANTIEGVEGQVLEQVVEPYKVGGEAPEQEAELPIDDAKKFQSMYDRKTADYDKLNNEVEELRKYQQLGKVLEQRPDVVEAMRNTLSGGKQVEEQPKQEQLSEDAFDPWEAYYKPGSPSYEMRVSQEKNLVNNAVQEQFSGLQKQMALNNLKQDLATKHGFEDPAMADDFIQFATNPRDELPIDMLVDVYRKYKGGEQRVSPNLEAVQRTQKIAPTAGIVQGASPEQPNEIDNVWSGVMGVSSRNKI
tara:strand:- start:104 stop:868 length:765 start_codon:yes stop_codon:yes gene_type:complete